METMRSAARESTDRTSSCWIFQCSGCMGSKFINSGWRGLLEDPRRTRWLIHYLMLTLCCQPGEDLSRVHRGSARVPSEADIELVLEREKEELSGSEAADHLLTMDCSSSLATSKNSFASRA